MHPNTLVRGDDLPSSRFATFHCTIDAVFFATPPAEFADEMMSAMLTIASRHNAPAVLHQAEVFDSSLGGQDFFLAVRMGRGHMTAHCDQDQAILSFDCLMFGSNTETARLATLEMHRFLTEQLGSDTTFDISHAPRFPQHRNCSRGNAPHMNDDDTRCSLIETPVT